MCKNIYQRIGRAGAQEAGVLTAPDNGESLTVSECERVELLPRLLNTMPDLHTINVSSCGKLVLHSKVTSVLDETQNKMQLH